MREEDEFYDRHYRQSPFAESYRAGKKISYILAGISAHAHQQIKAATSPLVPSNDFKAFAKGIPTDPDTMPPGQSQWHLVGTWGLKADQVWEDYTGEGVIVGVMDDGFQYAHSEISNNYRTDLDYDAFSNDGDPAPSFSDENHGTSVIGTILADDNGVGVVGAAFDAQGYGIRIDLHGRGGTVDQIVAGYQYALSTGLDVMNNSWGIPTTFADTIDINFVGVDFIDLRSAMANLASGGRGGLGSNIVFAAGNTRVEGDNVNYHNIPNSPYTITVAAIDQDGTYSYFSNPGAALLVSAGGTFVYTPDRTGSAGYDSGDYTNFSGTSAAAPVVSGAIAVMLEANPDLGWRDVQEILAYSAQYNDPNSTGWQYNGASNWNGGGLHFSHDYGFGATDLFTAVRLAETWDLQQTSANMTTTSTVTANPSIAITDSGTITTTMSFVEDIEIEHTIVYLNITHAKAGDLVVTLVSPEGTESVLINRPENGAFVSSVYAISGVHHETMSNANWGESSAGTWTLRVTDAAGGNTGTVNSWKLSFTGNAHSANDTYFYTDDYGNFTGGEATARATLTDTSGTDTLNLAAVTTNTTMNMVGGTSSTVAGKSLSIASGTIIENAYFGDGDDTVTGNSANNIIYGGRGSDNIDAGTGTDTAGYFDSIADYAFNFVSSTVVQVSTTLGTIWTDILTNFENFLFGEDTYTRAELEAYANSNGSGGDDNLNGTSGTDTISGGNGNDNLYGNAGDDILNGDAGNDYIDGGTGDDTMSGGAGSDTYIVDSALDIVIENNGEGTDEVRASITFILSSNIENLLLTGIFDIDGTGNALDNILTGNNGNNILDGGTGDDTMSGGAGSDTYIVDSTLDVIVEDGTISIDVVLASVSYTLSANIENMTLTGSANIDGTGNSSANVLTGNTGDNILDGGAGNDTLNGGFGNDTLIGGLGDDILIGGFGDDIYVVDSASDTITEYSGSGTETVQASVTYTLSNNLENLTLTGSGNIDGTGNTLSNTLTGNSGNNVLDGGAGNDTIDGGAGDDTMIGGTGNDTYYVDSTSDTITENASSGTDIVYASATFTLSTNIERLILTGSANIDGTGNSLNNILTGNSGDNTIDGAAGNDTIDGGAGDDTMIGGLGNDIYYVDSTLDVITENSGEGTDIVYASASYTLSADIERLILTGAGNIDGTGNSLNNYMLGNSGNNTLDGGTGNDTMIGELGDDIYVVDSASDLTIENSGGGTDTVQASITHTLANYIENLTLTGSGNIDGTGNAVNNTLTGNSGDNILDGVSGSDAMIGGLGNDTYIINSAGDTVTEQVGEGADLVMSSITYTLATNVENLTLAGTSGIKGTGNALDNIITGNSGNNTLDGGSGGSDTLYGLDGKDTLRGGDSDDFLYGGNHADTLTGGDGADTFVFENLTAFSGIDTVTDFNLGQNDVLDISDILSGYNPISDLLTDFVMIENGSGGSSILSVDRDGTGSTYTFTQIATLSGIVDITDEDALVTSGNLLV